MARSYDMTRRRRAAADVTERIAAAAEALLTEGPVVGVTLRAVAEHSGVTVQTVLRHMGSREGCSSAVRERVAARIDADRGHSLPGDVDAALAGLLAHYEGDGRLILNVLDQTPDEPWARLAADNGRAYHRAWVERCFAPLMDPVDRERTIDMLVVATDLYVWKLLRLDLGRSPAQTTSAFDRLVRAILELR